VTKKDVEAILKEINNAVLGYAMMVVMDDRGDPRAWTWHSGSLNQYLSD